MKPKKYHGVVIPLVTPISQNGDIDTVAVNKLIKHVLDAGTFPFVLGTTGECMSMPMEMRFELVRIVAEKVRGRTILYAGISDNSVQNSLLAAKTFFDLGVDVLVAHLPSYYPLKSEHIIKYYIDLAEKSPLPIMIYNIPSTTHISISLEVVDKLCVHPNICGLKDSERSIDRMEILGNKFSDHEDFVILSGWTSKSAQALISGFDGIVPSTGNVIPKMFADLYRYIADSYMDKALKMQEDIDLWADLHQKDKILCDVIPALKLMLNEIGICDKNVLPPLMDLTQAEENRIRAEMKMLMSISR